MTSPQLRSRDSCRRTNTPSATSAKPVTTGSASAGRAPSGPPAGPRPSGPATRRHPAPAPGEPDRLGPMRVFVGTDHAGLEFKDHLTQALAEAGHEPVDCGAFEYDAQDD